ASECRSAGEIDQRDIGMANQLLGDWSLDGVGRQRYQVRVKAVFLESGAGDLDRDRQRQNGMGVRLDHDRVTSGQTAEQRRKRIPGGKRADPHGDADAAREYAKSFLKTKGSASARLSPGDRWWHALHCVMRRGNRLQRAVLGVGAACLEGHHESL